MFKKTDGVWVFLGLESRYYDVDVLFLIPINAKCLLFREFLSSLNIRKSPKTKFRTKYIKGIGDSLVSIRITMSHGRNK